MERVKRVLVGASVVAARPWSARADSVVLSIALIWHRGQSVCAVVERLKAASVPSGASLCFPFAGWPERRGSQRVLWSERSTSGGLHQTATGLSRGERPPFAPVRFHATRAESCRRAVTGRVSVCRPACWF